MTLEIKIKMKGLKGKNFIASKKEKDILSGMLEFVFKQYGGLTKEGVGSYIKMVQDNYSGREIPSEVSNALYWMASISQHIHSFDVESVEVK